MFCVANRYDVGTDAVSVVVRWDDTVMLNLMGFVDLPKSDAVVMYIVICG